jgi:hypothetical protein
MKFYRYVKSSKYLNKIYSNNLTCIYYNDYIIAFFKNGNYHNSKNATFIRNDSYKEFWFNNKRYGIQKDFSKQTWRRFVKLKIFL